MFAFLGDYTTTLSETAHVSDDVILFWFVVA